MCTLSSIKYTKSHSSCKPIEPISQTILFRLTHTAQGKMSPSQSCLIRLRLTASRRRRRKKTSPRSRLRLAVKQENTPSRSENEHETVRRALAIPLHPTEHEHGEYNVLCEVRLRLANQDAALAVNDYIES